MCGNTGSYVDAPRHRFREGSDLAALSLGRLAHIPLALVDAHDRDGLPVRAYVLVNDAG